MATVHYQPRSSLLSTSFRFSVFVFFNVFVVAKSTGVEIYLEITQFEHRNI